MAAAFEAMWDGLPEGLVVTPYGYGTRCQRIKVAKASHPCPTKQD
ncbi:hypothetical protein PAYE108092_09925 [Paracoccus yeei]